MNSSPYRAVAVALALGGVAALVLGWLMWHSRPPQLGGDKEVMRAVDALFTAVTARDEQLLRQCRQRLRAHKDAGKLPAEAAGYLDGVIQQARAGQWEAAAQRLYDFMAAQRRAHRALGPGS
jgi:hypothetical protein